MSGKNTENQSKQKKKGDILLTLVLIVAIAVFCYAAVNLFHIYTEYKKGTDEYNHIEQMAVTDRAPDSQEVAGPNAQPKAPIDVDFAALKSVNSDVVGWIYIEALVVSAIRSCRARIMKHTCTRHTRRTIILQELFLWIMKTVLISATAILWFTDTI